MSNDIDGRTKNQNRIGNILQQVQLMVNSWLPETLVDFRTISWRWVKAGANFMIDASETAVSPKSIICSSEHCTILLIPASGKARLSTINMKKIAKSIPIPVRSVPCRISVFKKEQFDASCDITASTIATQIRSIPINSRYWCSNATINYQ
jgi:hypothetical protein